MLAFTLICFGITAAALLSWSVRISRAFPDGLREVAASVAIVAGLAVGVLVGLWLGSYATETCITLQDIRASELCSLMDTATPPSWFELGPAALAVYAALAPGAMTFWLLCVVFRAKCLLLRFHAEEIARTQTPRPNADAAS